jgi:hypothetical protein
MNHRTVIIPKFFPGRGWNRNRQKTGKECGSRSWPAPIFPYREGNLYEEMPLAEMVARAAKRMKIF